MSHLMFQCLLGVQGDGFVMIAADRLASSSVLIMKKDENKLFTIDKMLVGVNGDASDTMHFTQYFTRHVELYKVKNGYGLGTPALVHFARGVIVDGWKSKAPKFLNLLMGGFDNGVPSLYYMDTLGTNLRLPFACHGLGGAVSVGIMDSHYKIDMKEHEAYEMLKSCVQEIHRRLITSLPNFQASLVNKDGIQTLPDIVPVIER